MGDVKLLIVFSVAAFDLAVVSWHIRADELVPGVRLASVFSKRVSFFVAEEFSLLVNSGPLSV